MFFIIFQFIKLRENIIIDENFTALSSALGNKLTESNFQFWSMWICPLFIASTSI